MIRTCILLLLLFAGQHGLAQGIVYSLSGNVYDHLGEEAVEGAWVTLFEKDTLNISRVIRREPTDPSGLFSFKVSSMYTGIYWCLVEAPQYQPKSVYFPKHPRPQVEIELQREIWKEFHNRPPSLHPIRLQPGQGRLQMQDKVYLKNIAWYLKKLPELDLEVQWCGTRLNSGFPGGIAGKVKERLERLGVDAERIEVVRNDPEMTSDRRQEVCRQVSLRFRNPKGSPARELTRAAMGGNSSQND